MAHLEIHPYDWQVTVTYTIDLPHEQVMQIVGRPFTSTSDDDDDSFDQAYEASMLALEQAARRAIKDPGSWLSQSVANTEPDIEVA